MGQEHLSQAMMRVASMPPLSSSAAPNLAKDVDAAKAFANNWMRVERPKTQVALSDTLAAAQRWNSFYGSYAHEPPILVKVFLQGISRDLGEAKTSIGTAETATNNDLVQVAKLAGALTADATQIKTKLSGDQHSVAYIESKIAEAVAKAKAASHPWYDYLVPGYGLYLSIKGIVDVKAANKVIEEENKAIQSLSPEMQQLAGMLGPIGTWTSAMNDLTGGLSHLSGGVDLTAGHVNNVVQEFGQTSTVTPAWLKPVLDTINTGMMGLDSMASTLMQRL